MLSNKASYKLTSSLVFFFTPFILLSVISSLFFLLLNNSSSFVFVVGDLLLVLITIIPVVLLIAFFTLFERKLLASIQRRRGPNSVGFWGVLQPIADGLKLALKEFIIPKKAVSVFFILAPMLTLLVSFFTWSFIPFSSSNFLIDIPVNLLFILAFSSLGVYGIIISGWSSFSRYALLGSLRSIAQLVSYEISLSLIILPVIIASGSLNLIDIVEAQNRTVWFCLPFFPMFLMFLVSMLAETNRTPFDLPEAEAELVSGYNVEYSSIFFALFFLAEYGSMMLMSTLTVILFLGGWGSGSITAIAIFAFKALCVSFFFILVRGAVPRYRYDQLMAIGWKNFLVFGFAYDLFIAGLFFFFDAIPTNETLLWDHKVLALNDFLQFTL